MPTVRTFLTKHPRLCALGFGLLMALVLDVILGTAYNRRIEARFEKMREFRISSPIYHHDLHSNISNATQLWGSRETPVFVNSLGFRDRSARQVPLTSDHHRLLLMGDSFTEGISVDYEKSFAGLAEDALGKEGIEVWNGGVSSYSPIIYLRKIRHLIEDVRFRFDEVAVFIDISDIEDETIYGFDATGNVVDAHPRIEPPLPLSTRVRNFVRQHSLVLQLRARIRFARWMAAHGPSPEEKLGLNRKCALWTTDDRLYQEFGQRGLETAGHHMDELADLLKKHNVRLLLSVHPWPDQIYRHDLDSRQVRFWRQWAEAHSVPFLNCFPKFMAADSKPEDVIRRYFIAGDVHWNEEGHRLIADSFLAFYRTNRMVTGGAKLN